MTVEQDAARKIEAANKMVMMVKQEAAIEIEGAQKRIMIVKKEASTIRAKSNQKVEGYKKKLNARDEEVKRLTVQIKEIEVGREQETQAIQSEISQLKALKTNLETERQEMNKTNVSYLDLQNELNIKKQRVISAEQYAATMEEKKDESERSKEEVENKLKLATSWCEQLDTQLWNRKEKEDEMSKLLAEQFNVQRQNIYDECNCQLSAKDK